MFTGTTRYELVDKLGEGGMGVVYEAFDRVRGMRLALKALRHANAKSIYRFKREFRALRNLSHPNIINLYELASEGDHWFLTMELVDGEDIVSYVRAGRVVDTPPSSVRARGSGAGTESTAETRASGGMSSGSSDEAPAEGTAGLPAPPPSRLDIAEVVDVGRLRAVLGQLADALHTLHSAHLVHRDLKPSNLLVTAAGRLVLMDFGIVAELHRRADVEPGPGHVGTPQYMAPEQARGARATAATDWYAFGVLMYVALSGRLPYEGARAEVMRVKQVSDPWPPSVFTAGIPGDLEALCMALLRRDPHDRPAGADVLERLGIKRRFGVGSGEIAVPDMSEALFVGRERELATMHRAYAGVCHDGAACVLVQGLSGIGKSSLVERFSWELEAAAAPRPVVLSGRCHERESLPHKAFDGVIDDLARHLDAMPAQERRAVLPAEVSFLARLFPALHRAIDLDRDGLAPVGGYGPVQQRAKAIAALRELVAGLGEERPVVLLVEDLQWADQDSLDLLRGLLQPPAPARLLVVATLRTDDGDADMDGHRNRAAGVIASLEELVPCSTVEVGPLSPSEQREMIGKMAALPHFPGAHRHFDPSRYGDVTGHPMLLIELARTAPESEDAAGPPRLEDFLWGRLLGLAGEARVLMEYIALAGRPLPLRILARASGLSPIDSERAATTLRVANLARITRTDPEPWLVAYHDKVREAIGERVSGPAREAQHRRLAEALASWQDAPRALLADQWLAAGEPSRAAPYLLEAAQQSFELLAFDRAIQLYRAVLDMVPAHSGRRPLDRLRCEACIGLVQVMRVIDRNDEVLDLLDRAQAVATAHDLVEELATIHYLRGSQLFFRSDIAGCLQQHRQASEYARRAGSPQREARALSGLGDAYYMSGRMISAYEHFDRCIALSREHGFDDIAAANLAMRGMTRFYRNDLAPALQDSLNAVAAAARAGNRRAEIVARNGCLAWIFFDMGHLDRARRECEIALQMARELGARRFEPNSLTFLSKIATLEGKHDEAEKRARQSVALCREVGMAFVGPMALSALALATADPELRRQALDEGLALLRAGAASHNHLHFYRDAMEIALAAGDADAVERYSRGLEDYTRAEPLPWSEFYIARARALVKHACGRGDHSELRRLYDQALEVGLNRAARALEQALE